MSHTPSRWSTFQERLGLGRPELRAWALYDCANSAAVTSIVTAIFPIYFGSVAAVGLDRTAATRAYALATTAALGLVQACALDELLNGVRVGLARGHLVAVEGDIFGETVNRASRLADAAYPHSVLADDDTGEALAATGRFTVVPTKPRRLKGIGVVRSWVVRPARVG